MDNDLAHSNNLGGSSNVTALQLNVHLSRTRAQCLLTQHHVQLGGRHQGVVGEGAGGRGDDPGRQNLFSRPSLKIPNLFPIKVFL